MHDKILNYDKWLSTTIANLHQALAKYNIGKVDGKLLRSITGEVVKSGEDVEKIIIKFAQYGRFVDMGVRRGIKRRESKQRPWFTKTKTREVARLRELLAEHYTHKVVNEVESAFKAGA